MAKTKKQPLIIECCGSDALLAKFQNANKSLEDI